MKVEKVEGVKGDMKELRDQGIEMMMGSSIDDKLSMTVDQGRDIDRIKIDANCLMTRSALMLAEKYLMRMFRLCSSLR